MGIIGDKDEGGISILVPFMLFKLSINLQLLMKSISMTLETVVCELIWQRPSLFGAKESTEQRGICEVAGESKLGPLVSRCPPTRGVELGRHKLLP